MAQPPPTQIIQPSDRLRARVGADFGGVDPVAVARAEAALQALSGEFTAWLEEEVSRLEAARSRVRTAGAAPATLQELHRRAHDLKGLGATYGFPLVTRVCAGLCRLLDDGAGAHAPLSLLDAHVDAVRALVRDDVRDPAHPTGLALCEALEAQVAAALASRSRTRSPS